MLSLQDISDRLEIEDLIAAYADAIDLRDFDRLRDIFTADAHIDYNAFGGSVGNLEETIAYLKGAMRPFKAFQHLCGKSRVKLDGDTATARTQCLNPLVVQIDQRPAEVAWCALWYCDDLARTAQGWRIARRVEEAILFEQFPPDFAAWAARQD